MSDLKYAGRWFSAGIALVGAATGFLLALSMSPVVGIVLPLLFGLVGSTGGIYLARADLTSEQGRRRLVLIGQSAGALSLSLIVTSIAFLFIRSFEPQATLSAGLVSQLTPDQLVALAELRARLRILGASVDEQSAVINRSAGMYISASANNSASTNNLRVISEAAAAALKNLEAVRLPAGWAKSALEAGASSDPTSARKWDVATDIDNLKHIISSAQPLLNRFMNEHENLSVIYRGNITQLLDWMNRNLDKLIGTPPNEFLDAQSDLRKSLIALRLVIAAYGPTDTSLLSESKRQSTDNDLLRIIVGADHERALPTRQRSNPLQFQFPPIERGRMTGE